MKYSRSLLKGVSGPAHKALERELNLSHKSRKKHTMERRRRHHMAKPKLGSGGRFDAFKRRLEGKGMSANEAGAVAADAGRKKYGNEKMSKMSAIGRRKAAKNAE